MRPGPIRRIGRQVRQALLRLLGGVNANTAMRAAYLSARGREPSLDELGAAVASGTTGLEGLSTAFATAFHCEEALLWHLRALPGSRLAAPADVTLVSLGANCFTSAFQKRWGLKQWSGPFDWIFSSARMAAHCIEDDFRTFLDRSEYEPVPLPQRRDGPTFNRVDHRFYRDRFQVPYVFNHHDVHQDTDYGYLTRCVARFRQCLAQPGKKAFLLMQRAEEQALADLLALREVLARRTGAFRLICIQVEDLPGPSPEIVGLHADARCRVYRYRPVSHWHTLTFDNALDDVMLAVLVLSELGEFRGG